MEAESTPTLEARAALDLTLANLPPTPEDPSWREELGYLQETAERTTSPPAVPADGEVAARRDASG
ncbi:MAG TPA: hypothetical protein VFL91_27260 [Thermomicrobiales bacterium]|nr:hypothetical protein [Thermomicrobiales bacterium]